jgi:hypothetical protein
MKLPVKVVILLSSLLFLGFVTGSVFIPFFHELGHYSTAYLFNSSAIDKFDYSLTRAITQIIIPPENKVAHQVTFKGNIWEIFPEYQVILIVLSGLFFELFLFCLSILLLKKLEKKLDTNKHFKQLFFIAFGFYISFIRITISWSFDILGLLEYYSFNTISKLIISLSVAFSILLVWSFYLISYFRMIPRISSKYLESMKEKI